MSTDKSFTDEEARRILERAADRQEEADRAGDAGDVSLDDLKSIAEEAGIDPNYVHAAAGELVARGGHPPAGRTLGIQHELQQTRLIPGTVSDRQWEQMVGVLRTAFGTSGVASEFGAVREWIVSDGPRDNMPITVRLSPTEAGTLVTFNQPSKGLLQVTGMISGTFAAVVAILSTLSLTGVGTGGGINFVAMIFALAAAGSAGAGVIGSRYWVKRQLIKFESIVDKLELIGRSGGRDDV